MSLTFAFLFSLFAVDGLFASDELVTGDLGDDIIHREQADDVLLPNDSTLGDIPGAFQQPESAPGVMPDHSVPGDIPGYSDKKEDDF